MEATFPRKIEKEVQEHLKRRQASVITGMRRTGKTTLMQRIFDRIETKNKRWFDFENPLDVKSFEEIDYNHIVDNFRLDKGKRMFVFIDEIQNFPEVSKIMKYLIDHYQIKFVVTGSASYYLRNLFPESLAGRKQIFELFPLDFQEFLVFKGISHKVPQSFVEKARLASIVEYESLSKLFDEYLEFGGFPEVVKEEDYQEKKNRLKDIFSSYYEREILGLSDFRKKKEVRDLIILLAGRVGSRLDITKISQELGIQRITVGNYLQFLEDTYFIRLISPFSRSVDREISSRQKPYFCDSGLAQIISKQNLGQVLENTVFNLIKFYGKVNYYQRRRSELEIDFILDGNIAFEVKETATKADSGRLERTSRNLRLKNYYIISKNFVKNQKKVIYPQFL